MDLKIVCHRIYLWWINRLTNAAQTNVLVSDEGRLLICDFGRSKILKVKGFTTTTVAGTTRYMAPELIFSGLDGPALDPLVYAVTEKCDVYAYGMVSLEVQCLSFTFYIPDMGSFPCLLDFERENTILQHQVRFRYSLEDSGRFIDRGLYLPTRVCGYLAGHHSLLGDKARRQARDGRFSS